MNIPEIGEIVTPLDDPCQFNPAWRSIVAGHFFSSGVRCDEDFDSIARTGALTVKSAEKDPSQEETEPQKRPKAKKKKSDKKDKEKEKKKPAQTLVPLYPYSEFSQYRVYAADKWIRSLVRLYNEEADGMLSDESVPFKLASRWYSEIDHEAAVKKRIEALLLTEIGIDIVALDILGVASTQPAFEAYEKLYFNCRDENFSLTMSNQLLQRFAMPYGPLKTFLHKYEEVDEDGFVIGDGRPLAKDSDVWKAVAATMGYEALMYLWRWDRRAHGIKDRSLTRMLELSWKAAASRLLSDLYTGVIKHEDAARVLSAFTAQSKFISDEKRGGGEGGENDAMKALMSVLYQTAPHMITIDAADDTKMNDEIQSRIESQLAISKQQIEDKGSQVDNEVMASQISNAIEG